MKRYKRLGNEGDLNENNFDEFIEEIDDPTVFFQSDKVAKKVIEGESKLLPEKMTSTTVMPVRNTKDKFKRAMLAGK